MAGTVTGQFWWQGMKPVVAVRPFDQQLRSAIAQRRLLQLGYKGKQRLVEPHDYGIKNGVVRLLVYQLNDGSGQAAAGWRLLDTAGISACKVREASFAGGRGDTAHQHMEWDELFARVEPAKSQDRDPALG